MMQETVSFVALSVMECFRNSVSGLTQGLAVGLNDCSGGSG